MCINVGRGWATGVLLAPRSEMWNVYHCLLIWELYSSTPHTYSTLSRESSVCGERRWLPTCILHINAHIKPLISTEKVHLMFPGLDNLTPVTYTCKSSFPIFNHKRIKRARTVPFSGIGTTLVLSLRDQGSLSLNTNTTFRNRHSIFC